MPKRKKTAVSSPLPFFQKDGINTSRAYFSRFVFQVILNSESEAANLFDLICWGVDLVKNDFLRNGGKPHISLPQFE
jgi:hypothetical protein